MSNKIYSNSIGETNSMGRTVLEASLLSPFQKFALTISSWKMKFQVKSIKINKTENVATTEKKNFKWYVVVVEKKFEITRGRSFYIRMQFLIEN